jgi:hypothetical protein
LDRLECQQRKLQQGLVQHADELPKQQRNLDPDDHSTWNGCITDRGLPAPTSTPNPNNYDENVTAPAVGNVGTLFPAEQYSSCPLQMRGLSYDWTAMTSLVNQMSPAGNTNQAIGLAWGWLSLVGGGPLTAPAMDSNYQYQQVIILLTDGLNTQDRWYQSELDRCAPAGHLQQHQGRRHHAVYGAGRHRRRSDLHSPAELRHRRQQILPAEVGEPDHHHLHHDR